MGEIGDVTPRGVAEETRRTCTEFDDQSLPLFPDLDHPTGDHRDSVDLPFRSSPDELLDNWEGQGFDEFLNEIFLEEYGSLTTG